MLIVTIGGLNLKFLMKFSLCVTNILNVIRMLENFTYMNLGVMPPLTRVGVSLNKVHKY